LAARTSRLKQGVIAEAWDLNSKSFGCSNNQRSFRHGDF